MNSKIRFDFMKNRRKFFTASIIITLLGIIMLLTVGLNLGVDFKAGTSIDVPVGKAITKDKAEQIFDPA